MAALVVPQMATVCIMAVFAHMMCAAVWQCASYSSSPMADAAMFRLFF
jgi:hypothetical protein